MHREEKKEEMRGFYSSLLVSTATAAIILYAAVLKFSTPTAQVTQQVIEKKAVVEESNLRNNSALHSSEQSTSSGNDEETMSESTIPSPLKRGAAFYASGNINSAASDWERMVKASEWQNSYTIQLLLACKKETISDAFKNCNQRDELFFVRSQYREMTCYKLCMGLYSNRDKAESARLHVPDYFTRMGNRPVIIPIPKLVEGMK